MTIEERAKVIAAKLFQGCSIECKLDPNFNETEWIAKQIQQACDEARAEGFKEAGIQQYRDRNDEAESAYEKGFADCREKGIKAFDSELDLLRGQFEASRGVAVKRDLDICLKHQDRIRALESDK